MPSCIVNSCWRRSWNSCDKAKGRRRKAKGKRQKEKVKRMQRDIEDRAFQFALNVIKRSRSLPKTIDGLVVSKQLLRSGTSVGANVEEAEAGHTKHDFIYKMSIALKEARETHYWLRLADAAGMARKEKLDGLISEAEELKKILGAIVSKARNKPA
jgi:four helix bundle protein